MRRARRRFHASLRVQATLAADGDTKPRQVALGSYFFFSNGS